MDLLMKGKMHHLPSYLKPIKPEKCKRSPEEQLLAAVLSRALADYAYLLLIRHHDATTCYVMADMYGVGPWLRGKAGMLTAQYCCETLDIPWMDFRRYVRFLWAYRKDEEVIRRHISLLT